jgi:hypothetical protein
LFDSEHWVLFVVVMDRWEQLGDSSDGGGHGSTTMTRGASTSATAIGGSMEADDSGQESSSGEQQQPPSTAPSQSLRQKNHKNATAATTSSELPPHVKYNVVQFVNMPKTYVDHTYRDFSENLGGAGGSSGHDDSDCDDDEDATAAARPPREPHEMDCSWWTRQQEDLPLDSMTFHQKLYRLLTYTSSSPPLSANIHNNMDQPPTHHHHNTTHHQHMMDKKDETIVWLPHGRAFNIVDRATLDGSGLLKQFFGYTSLRRFEAQLRHHGYKPLVQGGGPDPGCYYSEVRG